MPGRLIEMQAETEENRELRSNSDVERLVSAPLPKEGEIVAITYRDNWDGEGVLCKLLAYMRDGEWYADESGNRLLQHIGDEIIEWWPLMSGTGNRLAP